MSETLDKYGITTLEAISNAPAFNQWTYDLIHPFCSGKIIELGSGIGNISRYFIEDKKDITLSDLRENYREYLSERFKYEKPNVRSVDMVHPQFEQVYRDLLGQFDTAFALNVVEHIEDHAAAVKNAGSLLKPGGRLIILVPAYDWLYNKFDRELGHYQRFNRKKLRALFPQEYHIIQSAYFNALGIPGWFMSGTVARNKEISSGEMKLFNRLVPVAKMLDALTFDTIGLSVWCVAQKPIE